MPLSKECNPHLLQQPAVGDCGFTGQLPEGSVQSCINVNQSIDGNVVNILKTPAPATS